MPNLLVRNLPEELHARLKRSAVAHRRSLTQEAILILERGIRSSESPAPLPAPLVPARPITMEETVSYMSEGRP